MKCIFRLTSAVFALCLVFVCAACGEDSTGSTLSSQLRSGREIIEEAVACYGSADKEDDKKIGQLLRELDSVDHIAAEKWTGIIELWESVNSGISMHYDVLPDGLPDTDECCMVALGFQLNSDGTMREELIDRLRVVKSSAEKYPHWLIVCTGGSTAWENPYATEAGKMAEWLIQNGIAKERVVVEDQSLTTAQNAIFTFDILEDRFPRITKLAVISSDYHIASGVLLFSAESTLRADAAGNEKVKVISHAACQESGSLSTSFQAGALRELLKNKE